MILFDFKLLCLDLQLKAKQRECCVLICYWRGQNAPACTLQLVQNTGHRSQVTSAGYYRSLCYGKQTTLKVSPIWP